MDLFENNSQNKIHNPLADQIRPDKMADLLGAHFQSKKNKNILDLINNGHLPNLIIWGPPGTGKTTFAMTLSKNTQVFFQSVLATELSTKEIKEIGEKGHHRKLAFSQKSILFIDEIHRLNKSQQDVLLSFVEKGDFVLIGATTENPGYELNKALLSRVHILRFEKLAPKDLHLIIDKTCHFLKIPKDLFIEESAVTKLIELAEGDARKLINSLELLSQFYLLHHKKITEELLSDYLPGNIISHDKKSDSHYDLASAMIKSIRGSDPQAAVYYLARLLEGGEDPLFIARRLVISASEDIGNAEPRALSLAMAAAQAVEFVGMPEARINLSQAIIFLACSPKSNAAYLAINSAINEVQTSGALEIPIYLKSPMEQKLLQSQKDQSYRYPHDFPKSFVKQDYLPEKIKNLIFYSPKEIGFEKTIKTFLDWLTK